MKLRIGTFNLYQYAEPPVRWYDKKNKYSEKSWEKKQAWIEKQIEKMECDVIGFQEVFSPKSLKKLVSKSGFKHFKTVDSPNEIDCKNKVFTNPIVAIASKYPIKSVEKLVFKKSTKKVLNLPDDFKFSRTPIKAILEIPNLGDIIVYVTHLKSKRSMIDFPIYTPKDSWEFKIREDLKARSLGHVASLLQRGAESAELYNDISNTIKDIKGIPVIVLGDLNDDPKSISVESILNSQYLFKVGEDGEKIPSCEIKNYYKYRLFDSFNLAPTQNECPRKATHYYNGDGNVLDYIFVSNMFNENNYSSKARVISYKTYNKHLTCNGYGDKEKSDHAQIVITIKIK